MEESSVFSVKLELRKLGSGVTLASSSPAGVCCGASVATEASPMLSSILSTDVNTVPPSSLPDPDSAVTLVAVEDTSVLVLLGSGVTVLLSQGGVCVDGAETLLQRLVLQQKVS